MPENRSWLRNRWPSLSNQRSAHSDGGIGSITSPVIQRRPLAHTRPEQQSSYSVARKFEKDSDGPRLRPHSTTSASVSQVAQSRSDMSRLLSAPARWPGRNPIGLIGL